PLPSPISRLVDSFDPRQLPGPRWRQCRQQLCFADHTSPREPGEIDQRRELTAVAWWRFLCRELTAADPREVIDGVLQENIGRLAGDLRIPGRNRLQHRMMLDQ